LEPRQRVTMLMPYLFYMEMVAERPEIGCVLEAARGALDAAT